MTFSNTFRRQRARGRAPPELQRVPDEVWLAFPAGEAALGRAIARLGRIVGRPTPGWLIEHLRSGFPESERDARLASCAHFEGAGATALVCDPCCSHHAARAGRRPVDKLGDKKSARAMLPPRTRSALSPRQWFERHDETAQRADQLLAASSRRQDEVNRHEPAEHQRPAIRQVDADVSAVGDRLRPRRRLDGECRVPCRNTKQNRQFAATRQCQEASRASSAFDQDGYRPGIGVRADPCPIQSGLACVQVDRPILLEEPA